MAADVADALDLDAVLWIPAGDPPHKRDAEPAPARIRLRMVRAAVAADPRFLVSDLELGRAGPSYTVDTLTELRNEHGSDVELFLVMGIDQYRAFESWHRPDEIRELATLVVMDRGGERADPATAEDDGSVVRVPVRRVDVSSTEVRAAVGRGEPVDDLVPPEAARIIADEGLYRGDGS